MTIVIKKFHTLFLLVIGIQGFATYAMEREEPTEQPVNAAQTRSMHIAASLGLPPLIGLLHKKFHQSINAQDKSGRTPLHIAIQEDHQTVATYLLSLGADPKISDHSMSTPLHRAVSRGVLPSLVQALIAHGAWVNAQDGDGNTPLHYATKTLDEYLLFSFDNIKVLLQHKADIYAENKQQETPIDWALSSWKNSKIIDLLLNSLPLDKMEIATKNIRAHEGRCLLRCLQLCTRCRHFKHLHKLVRCREKKVLYLMRCMRDRSIFLSNLPQELLEPIMLFAFGESLGIQAIARLFAKLKPN